MTFVDICKKTQEELKVAIAEELKAIGYEPIVEDGFVYARGDGNTPVLLTAHLDTVHKEPVKQIVIGDGVMSSPQGIGGDDRCGVWIATQVAKGTNMRPTILFCEDEEIGSVGAEKFIKTEYSKEIETLKFFVELDRANRNDAVFYDCDNPEFTEFIIDETGYKEAWGTFSDISVLAPAAGVAAVNLSCGYYKAHTVDEYVITSEMERTKYAVIKLLKKARQEDVPQYEYIEDEYMKWYQKYNWKWSDYDWEGYYAKNDSNTGLGELYVVWDDPNHGLRETSIYAETEMEAWGQFFLDNASLCYNNIVDFEWR